MICILHCTIIYCYFPKKTNTGLDFLKLTPYSQELDPLAIPMTHRIQPTRFQVSHLCLLLLPRREEPLGASHSPFHLLRRKQALQVDVCPRVQLLCFASHMFTPLYENLRFFMASALTARLLAQMVRTTMRTPTTNVTRGQRKQCRRTISSCVRCRSTSSGL